MGNRKDGAGGKKHLADDKFSVIAENRLPNFQNNVEPLSNISK